MKTAERFLSFEVVCSNLQQCCDVLDIIHQNCGIKNLQFYLINANGTDIELDWWYWPDREREWPDREREWPDSIYLASAVQTVQTLLAEQSADNQQINLLVRNEYGKLTISTINKIFEYLAD